MTDDDTRDPIVARALARIPTPEHGAGFWETVHEQLLTESRRAVPAAVRAVPIGCPAAGSDGDTVDRDEAIAELRPGARPGRPRSARLVTAGAAVLVVAMAVGSAVIADRDDPVGVTVEPDSRTTSSTSPAAASSPAERAALEWIDLLAAGDMRAAWGRLAPAARAVWPSYEAFVASRSAFAEGMGLWATAEGRQVGTAEVTTGSDSTIQVVTMTGTRRPEGDEEDGAIAILASKVADGTFLIDPFSPTSAGIRFTSPTPGPRPAVIAADTPVVVESPTDGRVFFVIDRDAEVVEAGDGARAEANYAPSGGWSRGRHVVTAVAVGPSGSAMAAAVVFDVP